MCTEHARDSLPLVVGRLYVENYFTNETKIEVANFATSIRSEFTKIISDQDWMDPETQKTAFNKANTMQDKYGFPEYLLNNSKIQTPFFYDEGNFCVG